MAGSSKECGKNWARLIQKIRACTGPDPGRQIRSHALNVWENKDNQCDRGREN